MRYICRFWDTADPVTIEHRRISVDASDVCEALVMGLRGLLPEEERHNLVAIAQKYSAAVRMVDDDYEHSDYPHV
jgi:hypothetical protein